MRVLLGYGLLRNYTPERAYGKTFARYAHTLYPSLAEVKAERRDDEQLVEVWAEVQP